MSIVGPEGLSEIPSAEKYQYSKEIVKSVPYKYQNTPKSEYLMNEFIDAFQELDSKKIFDYFIDLEKLYFLIACGSIICSVFYIAVLVKRYPIIRNIEIMSAGLDRARVWNEREEQILKFELENIDLQSDSEKIRKLNSKRLFYSDRVQYELANCDRDRIEIETKLKLISLICLIGLYIFFIVLFIGSLIIHPHLCIILSVVLIYAIITAKLIDYHYVGFSKNETVKKLNQCSRRTNYFNFF